jgi:hypothetical protein
VLDEWSENPASVPSSVYASINAALEAAGIYVTIIGVTFTTPIFGKKVFDAPKPVEPDSSWPFDVWTAAAAAAVCAGLGCCCVCLGYLFKTRTAKVGDGEDRYLVKPGAITEDQEKQLMLEYGYRPPLQGFTIATQTEPLPGQAFGAFGPGLAPGPSAGPAF